MAKRAATSELNHDNWDEDEEIETPDTFVPLKATELKDRVIKKAKRSLPNTNDGTSGTSPFAGFSGFSVGSTNFFSFSKNSISTNNKPPQDTKKENGNSDGKEDKQRNRDIEYYRHIQSLNESVMNWMQLHLAKNACCDFTPVFTDYKKHLDTLNLTYPIKVKDVIAPITFKQSDTAAVNVPCSSSNSTKDEADYGAHFSSNTTNTSTFSFGCKRTPTSTSSMSSGHPNSSEREEKFSFGLNPTFSFASAPIQKSNEGDQVQNSEEPEYVPPKNDFVAVKEENAFYSKRCKLFFKKDEGYSEKGVGILHLKPLDGKTQLLIRADTSLGNILLNIMLNASLPMSRTGKNNVLIMCVPNPPLSAEMKDSTEAIPMLIRVKTGEDADELLEILNKHKS